MMRPGFSGSGEATTKVGLETVGNGGGDTGFLEVGGVHAGDFGEVLEAKGFELLDGFLANADRSATTVAHLDQERAEGGAMLDSGGGLEGKDAQALQVALHPL